MKNAKFSVMMVAVLAIAGGAVFYGFSQNQDIRQRASGSNKADMVISPDTKTLNNGETSTFNVTLTPNSAFVKKAYIKFNFDSTVLDLAWAPITTSSLPTTKIQFSKSIPADSPKGSWATITLENQTVSGATSSASAVGSLTVSCKSLGTSKINLTGTKISKPGGTDDNPKDVDVTGSLGDLTITCAGTLTPTPTPTPKPSNKADLMISPDNKTFDKGTNFIFNVALTPNMSGVKKASVKFNFDSTVLDIAWAPITTSSLPKITQQFKKSTPVNDLTHSWATVTQENQTAAGATGNTSTIGSLIVSCKSVGTSKINLTGTSLTKLGGTDDRPKPKDVAGNIGETTITCKSP